MVAEGPRPEEMTYPPLWLVSTDVHPREPLSAASKSKYSTTVRVVHRSNSRAMLFTPEMDFVTTVTRSTRFAMNAQIIWDFLRVFHRFHGVTRRHTSVGSLDS